MNLSPRKRFVLYAACSYLFFGSAWIFFSDRLLMAFADISAITRLSTAKGIAFIILTTLLLILALFAIPDRKTPEQLGRYRTSEFLTLADQLPRWIAYAFAMGVAIAMLQVRMAIAVSFDQRPLLILFMLPIILSSVLGGFGPGLIATAIASLGIDYYAIPPLRSLRISESHDLFQWFMLIMSGILSSYLSELIHRARRQSEERRMLQEIAQNKLRQSEIKHRLLFENANDVIFIHNLNSRILAANPLAVERLGYNQSKLMSMTINQLDSPDEGRTVQERIERLMDQGHLTFETVHLCQDGSLIPTEVSARRIDWDGQPAIMNICRDITERKRADEALRKSEAQMRAITDSAQDAILMMDTNGHISYWNPAAERIFGYKRDEAIGKNLHLLIAQQRYHETFHAAFAKFKLTGKGNTIDATHELEAQHKNGHEISVELSLSALHLQDGWHTVGIIRDITERKKAERERAKLEAQLLQAQKMEAIGSLAGGIAHDLNNILFPISGLSEMLLNEIPPEEHSHASLEQIYKSAQRGSDLVKQILAFSRQSNPRKLPVRIQPILEEVLKLTRAAIPINIGITSNIEKDCGMVSADPTQIHQIVMNLTMNAYHAVEQTGGTIHVELNETVFNTNELHDNSITPGRYVCITVSDTGVGIDQTLIDKIFTPYFTTKELGKGTGLGLSVVHGIVKEHGGDIRVFSEVGKGTEFHVYFPLLEEAKDNKADAAVRMHPTGCERILLVDDEEPIVLMQRMMLERLGYQVTTRTSSPDALAAFKSNPNKFDLVISDRGMPNMTGEQLATALISIKPEIPVILCTGFCDEKDVLRAKAMGVKGFLMKPVAAGDMAAMVRSVLDEVNGVNQL